MTAKCLLCKNQANSSKYVYFTLKQESALGIYVQQSALCGVLDAPGIIPSSLHKGAFEFKIASEMRLCGSAARLISHKPTPTKQPLPSQQQAQ
jgi:hypothetical protein